MMIQVSPRESLTAQSPERGRSSVQLQNDDDFAQMLAGGAAGSASPDSHRLAAGQEREGAKSDRAEERPDETRARAERTSDESRNDGERARTDGAKGTEAPDRQASASEGGAANDTGDGVQKSSDSGQMQDAGSDKGVDGSKNGFSPGASTEATVSALASQPMADSQTAVEAGQEAAPPRSEAKAPAVSSDKPPIEKLADPATEAPLELETAARAEKLQEATRIAARVIPDRTAMMANWLNAGDRRVVFETGLAEQFLRAMTDEFDGSGSRNSGGDSAPRMAPNLALSGTDVSGRTSAASFGQSLETLVSRQADASQAGQANIGRILHVIRSNVGERQSQLTVQLDPPELGRLKIDVRLVDNQMRLNIVTETHEARQVLSERFEQLRSALESQGITVNRFEIQTREPQAQHPQWQNPQHQHGQHNQNFDSGRQDRQPPQRQQGPQDEAERTEPESPRPTMTVGRSRTNVKTVNIVA